MDMATFIVLLTAFGTATTLGVEFIKNILDTIKAPYNTQLVSIITGGLVGVGGTLAYYLVNSVAFTPMNIAYIVLEGIGVVIGSQIGYDKIVSVIKSTFLKDTTDA